MSGFVKDESRSGRPKVIAETINRVQQKFGNSPSTSIRGASRELIIPPRTVHKVLHKSLKRYPHKLQVIQKLEPNDKPRRKEFTSNILSRGSEDPSFLDKLCFSDEATFHEKLGY